MEATLSQSKPLFTSHVHRTTNIIHHQCVSLYNPLPFPGSSLRARSQQGSHHRKGDVVGAYLTMLVGTMSLSGAPESCPKIVGMRVPMTGKRTIRRVPAWRSLTLEGLRSGCLSLKVLLEAKKARLNPQSLDNALSELVGLLTLIKEPGHNVEFYKLEEVARKLEMGRKEDLAVKTLKKFLTPPNYAGLGPLETYEVNLILVEMLIYQGNYDEARDICNKLEVADQKAIQSSPQQESINTRSFFEPFPPGSEVPVEHIGPKNYRLLLYQAVTSALLDDEPHFSKYWKEFEEMSSSFGRGKPPKTPMVDQDLDEGDEEDDQPPSLPSGPPKTTMVGDYEEDDFEEVHHDKLLSKYKKFLEHVQVLKQEIQAARDIMSSGNH